MVIVANFLIFFFSYLIDSAKAFEFISIFGITPQLVFISMVCFCIFYGKERGLVMAVSIGIITDIITVSPIGTNAIPFLGASVLCGITYETVFEKNLGTTLITIFALTLVYNVFTYVFQIFIRGEYTFLFALWRYILPTCVYNTLVAPAIYWITGKVYYRNERIF